jgi:hypothetical protein
LFLSSANKASENRNRSPSPLPEPLPKLQRIFHGFYNDKGEWEIDADLEDLIPLDMKPLLDKVAVCLFWG